MQNKNKWDYRMSRFVEYFWYNLDQDLWKTNLQSHIINIKVLIVEELRKLQCFEEM